MHDSVKHKVSTPFSVELSKQMLEMSLINSAQEREQSAKPMVDCLVDDMQLQTRPCSNQVPL